MKLEHEIVPYHASALPKGPYLVFAPHYDDETCGMGGTILLASAQGIETHVLFITDGGKGGDPKVRKKEAQEACRILGVKHLYHLNVPDREVAENGFPGETVHGIIKEIAPCTIFFPSFQEYHPDHRAVTRIALQHFKKIRYSFDAWFYEIIRQGEINTLINITDTIDEKEQALECYQSQLAQLDYKSHTLCLDFLRSLTLGESSDYAEGFWRCRFTGSENLERIYYEGMGNYKTDSWNANFSAFLRTSMSLFKKSRQKT